MYALLLIPEREPSLSFSLWSGILHISSPGLRKWLAAFGVRHFETQEPSDLEYDVDNVDNN